MLTKKSIAMFGLGLTAGLLVCVGMVVGIFATNHQTQIEGINVAQLPPELVTKLHASSADGGASFAIATGPIDSDVEGLFALDFVTGELQCYVPNTFGKFIAVYKYNVLADLGIQKSKSPSFAMVTGGVNSPRGSGPTRPASSIVYVADCTSGNVAAYGIPWSRQAAKSGHPQGGTMKLLAKFKGRTALIREE